MYRYETIALYFIPVILAWIRRAGTIAQRAGEDKFELVVEELKVVADSEAGVCWLIMEP